MSTILYNDANLTDYSTESIRSYKGVLYGINAIYMVTSYSPCTIVTPCIIMKRDKILSYIMMADYLTECYSEMVGSVQSGHNSIATMVSIISLSRCS